MLMTFAIFMCMAGSDQCRLDKPGETFATPIECMAHLRTRGFGLTSDPNYVTFGDGAYFTCKAIELRSKEEGPPKVNSPMTYAMFFCTTLSAGQCRQQPGEVTYSTLDECVAFLRRVATRTSDAQLDRADPNRLKLHVGVGYFTCLAKKDLHSDTERQ